MALLQQTDDKHLVYKSQIKHMRDEKLPMMHSDHDCLFWNERILLFYDGYDENYWYFVAFDLLMNDSRPIYFEKSNQGLYITDILPLTNNFGLIIERGKRFYCTTLVELNWLSSEFQAIKKFERKCRLFNILLNKSEPSKFVMYWHDKNLRSYQPCKLVNKKFEFGETFQLNMCYWHYCGDKLAYFGGSGQGHEIVTYELPRKEKQTFVIQPFSDNVIVYLTYPKQWIENHLYIAVSFQDTENFGIAFTSLDTRQWILLDFETKLGITHLDCIGNNLFLLTGNKVECNAEIESTVKFYSYQLSYPKPLRSIAWLSTVNKMAYENKKNPHKAALKYLPLNTNLQSPWFEDEELSSDEELTSEQELVENEKSSFDEESEFEQESIEENESESESLSQDHKEAILSQNSDDEEEVPSKRFKFSKI